MEETFVCPRRVDDAPWVVKFPDRDHWRSNGTCSYCGSLRPLDILSALAKGAALTPTDKPYKAYLDGKHFYFQHFSKDERERFIRMLNDKQITFSFPATFTLHHSFIKND
jgi:hypothetical protein